MVPVYVHVCPALFVHRAVAEDPTVRQSVARFVRTSGVGMAMARLAKANKMTFVNSIVSVDQRAFQA